MSDDDLIRRGDALDAAPHCSFCDWHKAIADLPAVTVRSTQDMHRRAQRAEGTLLTIAYIVGFALGGGRDKPDLYARWMFQDIKRKLENAGVLVPDAGKEPTLDLAALEPVTQPATDARLRAAVAQLDAQAALADFTKTLTDAAAVATKAREAALREAADVVDAELMRWGFPPSDGCRRDEMRTAILALLTEKPHDRA